MVGEIVTYFICMFVDTVVNNIEGNIWDTQWNDVCVCVCVCVCIFHRIHRSLKTGKQNMARERGKQRASGCICV